jgi:hypothetical protein
MISISITSRRIARFLTAVSVLAGIAFAGTGKASAQSQSGFTYNGLNFTSYQANEYLNSGNAATAIKATGANYTAVMVTQYQQTSTSNTIAPETTSSPGYNSSIDPLSPTDAAVVSAIQSLHAQGITVSLKPQVDSNDGVFRGNFAPTNPTAWFASYQTFILHYAQIASQNNVGMLVIGTELKSLSTSTYKSNWESIISQIRAQYPNLTLAYGANATGAGDEFTSVSFWADVDIIGVDGYFPLTGQTDPTIGALVAAWSNNKSGFNIVSALKNLQSTYNKPLIFTEIGYVSVAGTNEQPYASIVGTYDATEQEDCYEAFFEVFSQQTAWMKGVFWWDWSVSTPSANDTGYSPQTKPAGNITLPKWFNSTTPGFTIAPSNSTLSIAQGLSNTDTIAVTPQGGFTGSVTLTATGLPSGVTAAFSTGAGTGTQLLTLTASSGAATGTATVTVTGTSASLTASTTIALTIGTPSAQIITFPNPGAQKVGTQLTLTATASSGLPVSFASTTPTVCTVNASAGTASLLATGTCSITASQAGNGTYAAATAVTDSFQVTTLTAVPVPAAADVIVSQVNWRAPLNGNAFASGNPAGSSFAVNSNGQMAVANTNNVLLFNTQTGVATTLGAWSSASALALDSKNNIYVGNLYGPVNLIVKLPYIGGTANGGYAAFTTPTASLAVCTASGTTECALPTNLGAVNPGAMTFDANGNLFYVTAGTGSTSGNSIYECKLTCLGGTGSPILIYTEPKASATPSSTSGQLLIGGLSIDSAGNIFFTDSSIYVNLSTFAITSFYSNLNELPVSTGAGFGGATTGYAASPSVLYTVTPSPVGTFDNQIDAVAVSRNAGGDTVYFADQNDGIFAFPDSNGGIPIANGQPTAMYTVSTQGAKTLALDSQNNLYLASYSAVLSSGGDTLAQVTVDNVTVPGSPVGTAVSPSVTLAAVSTILNDTACSGTPAPSVAFAGTSATATATVSTTGTCSSTLSGSSAFATAVSFTPTVAGADSIALTGTDQANNTGTVTVNGIGAGFTLSPSASTLSVVQGSSNTDTITVADFGGFTGSVTLAASGLPSGVTAGFATNPTTGSSVLTLTATGSATLGGPVTVTVTGTSGALTASTTIALTIAPPPSFTLSSAPGSLSVAQGSSNTSTITAVGANGFSGSVTLAATGLPSGVTASFATNPTTNTSVLTLTATGTAAVGGPVTVTITGTSGSLTASTTVALTVTSAPSFVLSPAAGSLSVTQGSNNTDSITVTPSNGFTGGVTLSATGLPSGVTASFSPNPTTTGSSVLTLIATGTATTGGPVTVTITGTSATLIETATVALTVNVAPGFTLSPSPASVTVLQGSTGTSTISVTDAGGFTGGVTLSATGLPSGVTASFATNPTTGSSVLTLTASSTASLGASTITIGGTSTSLSASTTIALTVAAPPSFTLAPSASTLAVVQGSSNTDTVTVTGANGFTGSVTLAATGLPSGVTAAFATNPATGSSVLTLTASSTATIGGPATVTINGTSGTLTASTTIALTVNAPPSFTLTRAASTLSVTQGSSSPDTITVTGANGFTGSVTLAATGLPSGVTASFATNPATSSSVLTLTASTTAAVGGPVTVTITGTSGTLTATTTIALTVNVPPSFTILAAPATVSIVQSGSATSTITVTSIGGFTGSVALTASGLPSGVSASFAAGTVSGTQVMTLTASSAASVGGPVTVTINGTSSTLTASTTIALTVTAAPGLTFSGSAITITRGATSGNTSTISVTPTNGFTGTVAFSCSIAPIAASDPATCTLSPTSVSITGTAAQTTVLTVTTTAATTAANRMRRFIWPSGGGTVLALLLFFGFPRRRRNLPALLALLLLFVSLGAVGCGGSGSNGGGGGGNPGTSPGSYTVTVTGTSGTTTGSGSITLTVQ